MHECQAVCSIGHMKWEIFTTHSINCNHPTDHPTRLGTTPISWR